MATSSKDCRLEPSSKQQTAVDEACGVVLDAEIISGEDSEGSQLLDQVDRIEDATGRSVKTVTADAGYAHGSNYGGLEQRGIEPVIPPPRRSPGGGGVPLCRFGYDGQQGLVRCPGGKVLRPGRTCDRGDVVSGVGGGLRWLPVAVALHSAQREEPFGADC